MKKSRLYAFLVKIVRPIVRILYRVKVFGLENVPKTGGYIICPNHTSNMDPVLLAITFERQIYFMAKAELFRNSVLRKILKVLGAFPVERGKGDSSAIDTAQKILEKGEQLGLFIEGTRSKTNEFLRPKTGCAMIAYKTNSAVIPVCITGANEHKLKIFRKNIVSIGKPISIDQLKFMSGTGKEIRDASRIIMENIKNLKR